MDKDSMLGNYLKIWPNILHLLLDERANHRRLPDEFSPLIESWLNTTTSSHNLDDASTLPMTSC